MDGNVVNCATTGTGQDGNILAGIPWPDPRFSAYLFACFIDNLTGLMWSANPIDFSLPRVWSEAVTIPPQINQCGFADWRLPNVNELQSLINAEQPNNALWLIAQGFIFPQTIDPIYWTSTSSAANPTVNAWNISMVDGSVIAESKAAPYLIWPVRGTSNPLTDIPPGQIAETGQITSVANYDDAFFANSTPKVGVPWPDPRFTVDTTLACVTDNLTGLTWSRDANPGGLRAWENALIYTEDLTVCGFADWRLPNSKELFSLIDRSQFGPALPVGYPFTNVQSVLNDLYWSSTTYAFNQAAAWTIDMRLGSLVPLLKTESAFVWPVRGGQTRPFVLTVKKLGDGQGTISAPDLTCVGNICTGDYSSYDVVTVTATAKTGSVFTEWGNCPNVSGNQCIVTVTEDLLVDATFLPEFKISVKPGSLNFKNLKQNVPSSPQTVTVTNVGVAPLDIISITLIGDDASVFTSADNCVATDLLANASCTITVTATSDNFDSRAAQLQISSTDPKKPTFNVKLKAKAKPPKIAKKPSSLNFGKVPLTASVDGTLTITNKGFTDLTIGAMTITGDNPGDFSLVPPGTCPTLANGESCVLTMRFTPSVADKRSAILNIPSNDPKKQPALTVKLKGTGE